MIANYNETNKHWANITSFYKIINHADYDLNWDTQELQEEPSGRFLAVLASDNESLDQDWLCHPAQSLHLTLQIPQAQISLSIAQWHEQHLSLKKLLWKPPISLNWFLNPFKSPGNTFCFKWTFKLLAKDNKQFCYNEKWPKRLRVSLSHGLAIFAVTAEWLHTVEQSLPHFPASFLRRWTLEANDHSRWLN